MELMEKIDIALKNGLNENDGNKSQKAKALGLVHLGFGHYENKSGEHYIFNDIRKEFVKINDKQLQLEIDNLNNNAMSDRFKNKIVEKDPENILYLKNPSERLQLMAIIKKPTMLDKLINKLERDKDYKIYDSVIDKAIDLHPYNIKIVENPSEKQQLIAVKHDGHLLSYIKNPSELVQEEAIKNNLSSIKYIKNPSDKIKKLENKLKLEHEEYMKGDFWKQFE